MTPNSFSGAATRHRHQARLERAFSLVHNSQAAGEPAVSLGVLGR